MHSINAWLYQLFRQYICLIHIFWCVQSPTFFGSVTSRNTITSVFPYLPSCWFRCTWTHIGYWHRQRSAKHIRPLNTHFFLNNIQNLSKNVVILTQTNTKNVHCIDPMQTFLKYMPSSSALTFYISLSFSHMFIALGTCLQTQKWPTLILINTIPKLITDYTNRF